MYASHRASALDRFPALNAAVRRLDSLAPLSPDETALILGLPGRTEVYAPGQDLAGPGAPIRRARLILDGWACCVRALADGRRQIFHFLLPGDLFGLRRQPGCFDLCATVALTRVQCIDATLMDLAAPGESGRSPGLAEALRRANLVEDAQLLDHMVRLGLQTAYVRMAHLLLELHGRLTVAGLAAGPSFPMPLTQQALGEALGLSIVHVNRTLQKLRREKLIQLLHGKAALLRPEHLADLTGFHPLEDLDRLHLAKWAAQRLPSR
jgi:CRP-like cAMP-binding protein